MNTPEITTDLHVVEVTKLPAVIMVLFGDDYNGAFAYAAKYKEPIYYVASNHSYYVPAHQKVEATK